LHSFSHLKVKTDPGSPAVYSLRSASSSVLSHLISLTGGYLALFIGFWSPAADAPPEPTPSHLISEIGQTGLIETGSTFFYLPVSLSNSGNDNMNLTESFLEIATFLSIFLSILANSSLAAPGYPMALQNESALALLLSSAWSLAGFSNTGAHNT